MGADCGDKSAAADQAVNLKAKGTGPSGELYQGCTQPLANGLAQLELVVQSFPAQAARLANGVLLPTHRYAGQ